MSLPIGLVGFYKGLTGMDVDKVRVNTGTDLTQTLEYTNSKLGKTEEVIAEPVVANLATSYSNADYGTKTDFEFEGEKYNKCFANAESYKLEYDLMSERRNLGADMEYAGYTFRKLFNLKDRGSVVYNSKSGKCVAFFQISSTYIGQPVMHFRLVDVTNSERPLIIDKRLQMTRLDMSVDKDHHEFDELRDGNYIVAGYKAIYDVYVQHFNY
jgi:hypothetical protein